MNSLLKNSCKELNKIVAYDININKKYKLKLI